MHDLAKTKAQLIAELEELRQQVRELQGRQASPAALRDSGKAEGPGDQGLPHDAYLQHLVEHLSDAVIVEQDGLIAYVNRVGARLLGAEAPGQLAGLPVWRIVPGGRDQPADLPQTRATTPMSLVTEQLLRLDGTAIDVEITALPIMYRSRTATQAIVRDVTAHRQFERLLTSQQQALELIATAAPLGTILERLVLLVEQQGPGLLGAVLLVGPDGQTLQHAAAPNLPDSYTWASQPVPIAPTTGSCGSAAYYREPVVVSDIAGDRRWADARELALRHGLQACWATPICSSQGELLGTFALYCRTPRSPSPSEWRLLELVSCMAQIAIEHQRTAEKLQQAHRETIQILERINDGFFAFDRNWRFTYLNQAAERVLGHRREDLLGKHVWSEFPNSVGNVFYQQYERAMAEQCQVDFEALYQPLNIWLEVHAYPSEVGLSIYFRDISERRRTEQRLREHAETLATLNQVGQMLSAELDLHKVVQAVTDAATELSGAQLGALFYHIFEADGQSSMLFTLSGAERKDFETFPMPRSTTLFTPTLRGESVIRIADVTSDPRYGDNAPFYGLPPGHPPVRSYMAVPVVSRSGEVLGGLFLGHPEPGVFTEQAERLVVGLASQAASAMDNARLFDQVQSERLKAELNERTYRTLAETIPQIVWTARPDGWLDYYNQNWFRYTGLTLEQSQGVGWALVLHPDDLPRTLQRWEEAVRSGESYEIEYRFKRASDGVYRWHLGRALPMRDHTGSIIKWFGTCTDIDDQKRAQEVSRFLGDASVLLGSSLDYETTLAQMARLCVPMLADWCAIDILDDNGAIQRVGLAHVDPDKEQLLWQLTRRYPPRLDDGEGVALVMRTGQARLIPEVPLETIRAFAKDPALLEQIEQLGPRSHICVPLVARERLLGTISLTIGPSTRRYSPTDLALAEELARRAALALDNARLYHDAQLALRVRDQFLALAAHELKTPLTAILGHAQLLERRALRNEPLGERGQRTVRTLIDQVRRLSRLTSSVLDLARIQEGRLTIEHGSLDICALVRQIAAELQPTLTKHTLQLSCIGEPCLVAGDRLRLEQVVQNLLQNAVKYSPAGGTITVSINCADQDVRIRVSDQGVGIPTRDLPHIFDRFYRASNVDAQQLSGMGVGLYVVREIVTLHGGSVQVESVEGQGSSFEVRLPRS